MPFDNTIFANLEADLPNLEIDQIKERLQPLMIGYGIQCPIYDPGAFLYRARRFGPNFNKTVDIRLADLIYPPSNLAKIGRLNRVGQSIFYASMHKQSVFFELPDLSCGDEVLVTFWKTKKRMLVNNIGYTEFAFNQLGAKRPLPNFANSLPSASHQETITLPTLNKDQLEAALRGDQERELKEAFSKAFMRKAEPQHAFQYKMTVAIAELHLGEIQNFDDSFAGILYPSTRMWANGDNVALLPDYVDNHIELRNALHIKVKSRTETTIEIESFDEARSFDAEGKLVWLGRMGHWIVGPHQLVKATAIAGVDADGDYSTCENGGTAHWEVVDATTGTPILRG
ncbi:RES domain protein [Anatilimnocola aggregata]|uniref:RES domain protein n=1 Tax=Anatilimnocola aggregata TaxID=2528021 RepID=A0A517Y9I5_9BACT|nr:hypothetical protein [Anatilimnocola aggregata]QDU26893.1 RES domain protein [Anatilimnocola aggregata]